MVEFGRYKQGSGDEIMPIEWQLLDLRHTDDGVRFLLLSEKGLDCKPYNEEFTSVSWENCTLRKWLNNDFFSTSFTLEEQARIALSDVPVDDFWNIGQPTTSTKDKIFLLSFSEVRLYFSSSKDQECYPTEYAEKNDLGKSFDKGFWWLRSSGFDNRTTAIAGGLVIPGFGTYQAVYEKYLVRPAFWFRVSKSEFEDFERRRTR